MSTMPAEPDPGPLDPVRILAALPEADRDGFRAAYREAVAGAADPDGFAGLWRLLRLWQAHSLMAARPGYAEASEAAGCPVSGGMTLDEPVVPMPERTPRSVRAAVAHLDPGALPRFEAEWTAATVKARDEYSSLPVRHFTEKWHLWVAVRRWPELAARLRECERRATEARDLEGARAASAEIGEILRAAADAAPAGR